MAIEVEKKELNVLKAHLSSIFARKQKHLWIDPSNPLVWYFSTIGVEMPDGVKKKGMPQKMVPIFAYKPTMDDFIHRVEFADNTILATMLKVAHPIISEGVTCTILPEMLAMLNKGSMASAERKGDLVVYEKRVGKQEAKQAIICYKTDTTTFEFLRSWFNAGVANVLRHPKVLKTEVDPSVITRGDVVHLDIDIPKPDAENESCTIRLPVLGGASAVSIAEYTKKVKQEFELYVNTAPERRATRSVFTFKNDSISVISVQPSAIWFPLFK